MLAAFAVSTLFLVLYVAHKASRGFESTALPRGGRREGSRTCVLLFSHVVLAMTVPPLAIALIVLGLRGAIARHRRLARFAWPIWMYVSVTGVLIYVLLYHLNPAAGRVRVVGVRIWLRFRGRMRCRGRLVNSAEACYLPATQD